MSNQYSGILRILHEQNVERDSRRLNMAIKGRASAVELKSAIIAAKNSLNALASHAGAQAAHVTKLKKLLVDLGQSQEDDDGAQNAEEATSASEKAAYGKHDLSMLSIIRAKETPAQKSMRLNEPLQAEKAAIAKGRAILAERDHIAKKAAQKSSGQSELDRVRSGFIFSAHEHPSVVAERARKAAKK